MERIIATDCREPLSCCQETSGFFENHIRVRPIYKADIGLFITDLLNSFLSLAVEGD